MSAQLSALQSLPHPDWLRVHPACWQPGILDKEALYAAAARQEGRATHLHTAKRVAAAVLALLDELPLARRALHDTPMYLMMVCCMALHHRRDRTDATSGITLTSLRALFAPPGVRSFAADSHLRDMMAWARVCGLLQPACPLEPVVKDRRVRRYAPSSAMEHLFKRWMTLFLEGMAPDLPSPWGGAEPPLAAVYEVLSWRIALFSQERFVPTERHELIQQFMMKRHGYHVFLALLERLEVDGGGVTATLSLSSLGERLNVARGTVRGVIELAEHNGLLRFDRRAGVAALTPDFLRLALSWMGLEMIYMHGLCEAAASVTALPPHG